MKKLLKINLNIGFNCIPQLIIKYYESEEDEKNMNEIIMDYENNTSSPHWNSYIILEQNVAPDKLKDIIKKLYSYSKFLLENAKDFFINKVDEFYIPQSDEEINKIINEKFHTQGGGAIVDLNEFKEYIVKKTLEIDNCLIAQNDLPFDKWESFLETINIYNLLDDLINKMSILFINGENIEFKIKNNYISTMNTMADKLAKNLFYEFKKQQTNESK